MKWIFCSLVLCTVILPVTFTIRSKHEDTNPTLDCPNTKKSTFLWRINTSPPSYFFGSVHVPYTRVWDYIADNVKQAFKRSNRVYFELDLTDAYTIQALTTCQLLPGGANLTQVLPGSVYDRLESHLRWVRGEMGSWLTPDQRERGLHPDHLFNAITANWVRKRPIWAMLMVYSLTPSDIASRGSPVLDLYLAQLADKFKKGKGAVETVDDQCGPINGLSLGQVVFALNQTLEEQEAFRRGTSSPVYTTEKIVTSYKCGEIDSFSMFSSEYSSKVPLLTPKSGLSKEQEKISEEINQYFKEHLINRRNRRMSRRVIELLFNNRGQSLFFVFGAGHFVANYSIIQMVRKSGFQVEEVAIDEDLDTYSPTSNYPTGFEMSPGRVAGTFHDLSDEEKTKAFLQLLEHQLKVEKERGSGKKSKFGEEWHNVGSGDVYNSNDASTQHDIDTVRESVKIWYGLSSSSDRIVFRMSYVIMMVSIMISIYR